MREAEVRRAIEDGVLRERLDSLGREALVEIVMEALAIGRKRRVEVREYAMGGTEIGTDLTLEDIYSVIESKL